MRRTLPSSGITGSTSWMGMNLAKMTVGYVAQKDRIPLIEEGVLSPISRFEPFSPLATYGEHADSTAAFPSVPALTDVWKSTCAINMNHAGFIRISQKYLGDALVVFNMMPSAYFYAVRDAWAIYFWNSSNYKVFEEGNIRHIRRWYRMWNRTLLTTWPGSLMLLIVIAALPLSLVGAAWLIKDCSESLPRSLSGWFIAMTIVYVAVVGNSIEIGENNRFRFVTDPLMLAAMTVFVTRVWSHLVRLTRLVKKDEMGTFPR